MHVFIETFLIFCLVIVEVLYLVYRPVYVRNDFCNSLFSDSDFMFKNKFDEVVRVVFPVYMYSHVKFVKLSCNCSDFCEVVSINLLKEHCEKIF